MPAPIQIPSSFTTRPRATSFAEFGKLPYSNSHQRQQLVRLISAPTFGSDLQLRTKMLALNDFNDNNDNNALSRRSSYSMSGETEVSDLPPEYCYKSPSLPASATMDMKMGLGVVIPHIPSINYHNYKIPSSTISPDKLTLTTTHSAYHTNAVVLVDLIAEQAALPPRPLVRITGKDSGTNDVNFDFTLAFTSLLDNMTGAETTVKAAFSGEPLTLGRHKNAARSLSTWAKLFCADESVSKSFTLTRQIRDFDTAYAELTALITEKLNYNGDLLITFVETFSKIVVQPQTPHRSSGFLKKMLRLTGEGGRHDYDVVESVWDVNMDIKGWWETWAATVHVAVTEGRTGNVGVEDWVECTMGWNGVEKADS